METVYIYELIDPLNNQTRYIGKSVDPETRFHQHLTKLYRITHKINWIKSLLKENLKPILNIIDEVPNSEWEFWECYWIAQYRAWNINLTNSDKGGKGWSSGERALRLTGNKNSMFGKTVFNTWVEKYGLEIALQKDKLCKEKQSKSLIGKRRIRVVQYDLNDNFIKEYDSLTIASIETNTNVNSIIMCCKGTRKRTRNHIWKYKNKDI